MINGLCFGLYKQEQIKPKLIRKIRGSERAEISEILKKQHTHTNNIGS